MCATEVNRLYRLQLCAQTSYVHSPTLNWPATDAIESATLHILIRSVEPWSRFRVIIIFSFDLLCSTFLHLKLWGLKKNLLKTNVFYRWSCEIWRYQFANRMPFPMYEAIPSCCRTGYPVLHMADEQWEPIGELKIRHWLAKTQWRNITEPRLFFRLCHSKSLWQTSTVRVHAYTLKNTNEQIPLCKSVANINHVHLGCRPRAKTDGQMTLMQSSTQ